MCDFTEDHWGKSKGQKPYEIPQRVQKGPGYFIANGIIAREVEELGPKYSSEDIAHVTNNVFSGLNTRSMKPDKGRIKIIGSEIERIASEKGKILVKTKNGR